MNEAKLSFNLGILKHFINNSLNTCKEKNEISGFKLIVPLLEACAYNTYVEAVSNKIDLLYLKIKNMEPSVTCHAYLNYIRRLSKKLELPNKEVVLAFDYTDEDFYGNVQGFNIHGRTKKEQGDWKI